MEAAIRSDQVFHTWPGFPLLPFDRQHSKLSLLFYATPLKRRPREEESLPSFLGLINYSAVGFLLLPPLALPACLPFILHWICVSHYRGVRSSSVCCCPCCAEKNASSVHTNHPFISRGGSATVQEMPRPTNRGIKPVLHTIHNTSCMASFHWKEQDLLYISSHHSSV